MKNLRVMRSVVRFFESLSELKLAKQQYEWLSITGIKRIVEKWYEQ